MIYSALNEKLQSGIKSTRICAENTNSSKVNSLKITV